MNTNMTGFRCFFKNLCVLVLWMKVALALEGLIAPVCFVSFLYFSQESLRLDNRFKPVVIRYTYRLAKIRIMFDLSIRLSHKCLTHP